MIVKIVGPLSHHATSDESLQRTKSISIIRCDKADGISDGLGPSRSPDAVDIIFRVHREIEIHDVRNAVHVNASGRNIGGHEHTDLSRFKGFQGIQALVLGAIGMERRRRDLRSSQALSDSVGAVLRPREDEHRIEGRIAQQVNEKSRLQTRGHFINELGHGLSRIRPPSNLHHLRSLQKLLRERLDLLGKGR